MYRQHANFIFLNIGHFLDHFFVLIIATAALHLTTLWQISYSDLIIYTTPAFIAFGIGSIPAGWLADRWSHQGMMVLFFFGIGISSILVGTASTPLEMGVYLTFVGLFAAIYHPVGLSMIVGQFGKAGMPIAINGIFGNMGVACAALVTGFLIDKLGWHSSYMVPGAFSVIVGVFYLLHIKKESAKNINTPHGHDHASLKLPPLSNKRLLHVFGIILFTSALGGLIFQSTTFSLPKVYAEQLSVTAINITEIGGYIFITFALASFAQLLIGYLADKHSIKHVFAAVAATQATLFFVMTQTTGLAILPVAIALMFAVFSQVPLNDLLVGKYAHKRWRSRAYALRSVITFLIMAITLPIISWIHSGWGFSLLFAILSVAALMVFLAVLLLPKQH